MILEFPASYCHLARRIAQVYLLFFFFFWICIYLFVIVWFSERARVFDIHVMGNQCLSMMLFQHSFTTNRTLLFFSIFEHVQDLAVFLFNDAMVVTVRSLCHIPYTQRCETRFTYHSSVALDKLLVVDVPDTKCKSNYCTSTFLRPATLVPFNKVPLWLLTPQLLWLQISLFEIGFTYIFILTHSIHLGIAHWGSWGQSATPDSEIIAKNWEKRGKIGKKEQKSGKGKAGNREGSFTFPLLTDRPGYATSAWHLLQK